MSRRRDRQDEKGCGGPVYLKHLHVSSNASGRNESAPSMRFGPNCVENAVGERYDVPRDWTAASIPLMLTSLALSRAAFRKKSPSHDAGEPRRPFFWKICSHTT